MNKMGGADRDGVVMVTVNRRRDALSCSTICFLRGMWVWKGVCW